MKSIHVSASTQYDILIEKGIIEQAGKYIRKISKAERAVIVTDSNVAPIYGQMVCDSLKSSGFDADIFVFEAGESSKRLATIEKMYSKFAQRHITRADIVVALGGGVTGDMAGFAAATWLRGIDFVQIPTSLLAQIDSSVGGKTGVDLNEGKNLVGAFWQPKLVLIDPNTLNTLPKRFFSDGMAEAIKYGCIKSAELFNMLEENDISDVLEDMIFRCVDIKRMVVENDEKESGERMLLNFGHTMGHAIEKFYNYTGISHGEAVGIGMIMMIKSGEAEEITDKSVLPRVQKLLEKFSLPTSTEADTDTLCKFAGADKKCSGSGINVVLIDKIGSSMVKNLDFSEFNSFVKGGLK